MTDTEDCPFCGTDGEVIDPSTAKCRYSQCNVVLFRLDRRREVTGSLTDTVFGP